jgi:hypothetical protein
MGREGQNAFEGIANGFVAFLPNLLAGLGLIVLGLVSLVRSAWGEAKKFPLWALVTNRKRQVSPRVPSPSCWKAEMTFPCRPALFPTVQHSEAEDGYPSVFFANIH